MYFLKEHLGCTKWPALGNTLLVFNGKPSGVMKMPINNMYYGILRSPWCQHRYISNNNTKCTTYHLSKVRNMGTSVGTCTLMRMECTIRYVVSREREDISGVQSSSLRKAHTAQLQVGPRLCMAGRWIHHVFLSIFPLRLFSTYDFPRPYQDDPRSVCC